MTKPVALGQQLLVYYSAEAIQARVQGVIRAKCVVMTDGTAENCRITKGLPYFDSAVLDALNKARYKPATFRGRPIAVDYDFHFSFFIQDRSPKRQPMPVR